MYVGNSLIHSGMIFGFTIGILEHGIADHLFHTQNYSNFDTYQTFSP